MFRTQKVLLDFLPCFFSGSGGVRPCQQQKPQLKGIACRQSFLFLNSIA